MMTGTQADSPSAHALALSLITPMPTRALSWPKAQRPKGPKACNAFGSRCAAKRSSSTPRRVAIALAWPHRRADAVFLASRVDMICGKRGLAGLLALTNPTGGTCKTPNRPSGCKFNVRSPGAHGALIYIKYRTY
jgi:hypothetical protein